MGAHAGRIHCNKDRSPNSHYFIHTAIDSVETIMAQLDLASAAANASANSSLAKSKVVALYSEWLLANRGC